MRQRSRQLRHLFRITSGTAVAVVAAALLTTGVPTAAIPAPPPNAQPEAPFEHGDHAARDVDNRLGTAVPDARQRAAASRVAGRPVAFNAFGTPYALGGGTAVLAKGLSADPETAARQYLTGQRDLFGFDDQAVANLERVSVHPVGSGAVVLLRQRFGGLPAGPDGLVAILVNGGTVVRVTSTLARETGAPAPATLPVTDAVTAALGDAGLTREQLERGDARLVAVPTPTGARAAYAVTLIGGGAEVTAFTTYIDARTGGVLLREDLVDFDTDNPTWAVFPATPTGPTDNRVVWCAGPMPGCVRVVRDAASGLPWDVDVTTGQPTLTSSGNSANTVQSWGAGTPPVAATPRPDRNYRYPWTDPWRQARCDPALFTSLSRIDGDAATANLFAMHNRMHDWSYHLGFTEAAWNLQLVNIAPGGLGGDAEQGRAQANALGGSRNNANQATPRDGLMPTTNMFLWQPVAGAGYPPCVDGDYDMTVIGHEYTHAITNRMVAGPDAGLQGAQGGAMGESWSDLLAQEYLYENGYRAPGDTPWITGGYVTGNLAQGIRNYDFSRSPLNYSDIAYDLVGQQVHADGEIWSATNFRIRTALVKRYGAGTPALQLACAEGQVSVQACPGNRRWMQLVFDAFLLQAASQVSYVDMRDNMLAADLVRFGGANQDILWNAFAESGLGQDAASNGSNDPDPTPSFASPYADNATVTLRPVGESTGAVVRLYAGDFEARATPVADTDPETPLGDTFQVLPTTRLSFVATGPGLGHHKFRTLFLPGRAQELRLNLPRNLASTASGATVSGDGVNLDRLADDTEATNWASLDGVAGRQVTIDLAGDRPQLVQELKVSAMLRPPLTGDPDPLVQNRFTALRSFEVLACNSLVADCAQDAGYTRVFVSAADAFDGGAFRPTAPQLTLRNFHLAPTAATHLRVRVLSSQCTGNPRYAGEQDNDPNAATDCATASPNAAIVRIAEVQAFTR